MIRLGISFGPTAQGGGNGRKSLSPLSLSASSIAATAGPGTLVGDLLGKTAGSTLALTDGAGSRFALGGTAESPTIVRGTAAITPGSYVIDLRETMAGYKNSPLNTTITIDVTPVVVTQQGKFDFTQSANSGLLILLEEI